MGSRGIGDFDRREIDVCVVRGRPPAAVLKARVVHRLFVCTVGCPDGVKKVGSTGSPVGSGMRKDRSGGK